MFNVRIVGDQLNGKWFFTWLSLVVSLWFLILCCLFSREMSWMRTWTELSQFLRLFLLTLLYNTSYNFANEGLHARQAAELLNNSVFDLYD